jgi:HPt (histidine-containing phosphotransfer) domain-containing protein
MPASTAQKLPPGLPEVLRAAHDVFINLTEERILRIETLAQAVHRGEDAAPALTEIAQICHKIAGVAGTLGYPDIGDTARTIEQQLKANVAAGDPLRDWDSLGQDIDSFLDALESLL